MDALILLNTFCLFQWIHDLVLRLNFLFVSSTICVLNNSHKTLNTFFSMECFLFFIYSHVQDQWCLEPKVPRRIFRLPWIKMWNSLIKFVSNWRISFIYKMKILFRKHGTFLIQFIQGFRETKTLFSDKALQSYLFVN